MVSSGLFSLGLFLESKAYLSACSFSFQGNIKLGFWEGGCVKAQADYFNTSLPYWGGEGESNFPAFCWHSLSVEPLSGFVKDETGFSRTVLGCLALCLRVQGPLPVDICSWPGLSCGLRTLHLNVVGRNGITTVIRIKKNICKPL